MEWISVEDRLPANEDKILLFVEFPNAGSQTVDCGWYITTHGLTTYIHGHPRKPFQMSNGDEDNFYDKDDHDYFIVTHWSKLPEKPEK